MRVLSIFVILLVAGCSSGGGSRDEHPGWRFEASPGMPMPSAYGNGGAAFSFPYSDGVHYLVKPSPVSAATSITAKVFVGITAWPTFNFRTNPNNTCSTPSSYRLYFQRRGDSGYGQFHRWWNKTGITLPSPVPNTSVDVVGDLTKPSDWSSVQGISGDANPEATRAFYEAARDLDKVGFTFGGGCFYGHGVFIDPGTGSASLRIESFAVQ